MGYYQDYIHETNGMLILSEDGFDRLVVGDPVPDPSIGRRSAGANTRFDLRRSNTTSRNPEREARIWASCGCEVTLFDWHLPSL